MQAHVQRMVTKRVEPSPVIVQAIREVKQLSPACTQRKHIAECTDIHQVGILQNNLQVVEDELALQTRVVTKHGQSDERQDWDKLAFCQRRLPALDCIFVARWRHHYPQVVCWT